MKYQMGSFKRNLIIGYSLSLLLLLGSSVASFISIKGLLRNAENIERANLIISKLEHAKSELIDAEMGQRGYLLTGEDVFLDPYNGSLTRIFSDIKALRELTTGNQLQHLTLIKFTDVVQKKMDILQDLIIKKRVGGTVSNEELREGKASMDQAKDLVNQMKDRETQELMRRTRTASEFAKSTPLFIIIASILAVLITIFSFLRVNSDFARRQSLQSELIQKNKEVGERINIISSIAEKVSEGDYKVRVEEGYEDKLGKLAVSLNKMTASLHTSFSRLSQKEWLQTGISQLNEKMLGEQTLDTAASGVLEQLTEYTGSALGAFYLCNNNRLEFTIGHSFIPPENKKYLSAGEGIAGQAMISKKIMVLKNIENSDIMINYAAGEIKPREIIAIPFLFEGSLKAVVVLASINLYGEQHIEYLHAVAGNIAIVINTAETRKRLNELLSETQEQAEQLAAQAEELSLQHGELEKINSELGDQSVRLMLSEKELRIQREGLIKSNNDLEERTRLLEERNQLIAEQNRDIEYKAEQLEIGSRYKSEFLANMSHELRTPLNSILLLSRLMTENVGKNLTPEQVEYARVIQGSGHGLLALIDDILDLSQVESGKMDIHFTVGKLQDIVEDMRSLFNPVSADKNVKFKTTIAPDAPENIETDFQRLEQVLKNLLSNAFKFTLAGTVTLSIAKERDNKLSFAVSDTGVGIAENKKQLIFEAFRQEDGSTRRNYGGTGLGLSISRELARLLGGEIRVQSEQGKGSTFTLIVPQENNEIYEHQKMINNSTGFSIDELQANRRGQQDGSDIEVVDKEFTTVLANKKVLLVDDDVRNIYSLSKAMEQYGIHVITAMDGHEAIRQLETHNDVQLVLIDMMMPGKDGYETSRYIRKSRHYASIPIIAVTAKAMTGDRDKCIEAGASDYITKPVDTDQLVSLLRVWLFEN